MSSVFKITLAALLVIAALVGSPAWARFPTYLEIALNPNPAAVGEKVTIECRLWAKGAANTTQRVRGGLLRISIYDLDRGNVISQSVETPSGQYDVYEFPWLPSTAGNYRIEASYTGSGFLASVTTSRKLTVTLFRTTPRRPPAPTTTTTTSTTTTTTTTSTTTTAFLTTTTTLPPAPPPPPTTLPPPPPPPTTLPAAPSGGQEAGPGPAAQEKPRVDGLEESTITEPPPPSASQGPSREAAKEPPQRTAEGKLVTRLKLSSSPGRASGEYLIKVEVSLTNGRSVEEGEILVTVNGGQLDPGAGGQALLSAPAGPQFVIWKAPSRPIQKRYTLEADYFGGRGPEGEYSQSSATLELPPAG